MIYYMTFFTLSLMSLFNVVSKSVSFERISLLILCVFLSLLAGLRGNVGYDYQAYVDFYNLYESYGLYPPLELTHQIIYFLAREFGDVGFVFLFTAILSVFIKIRIISKLSKYALLSVLLYFSQEYLARDFGNIRQGLAISFFMVSCYFCFNKRLFWQFFFSVLSVLTHTTAFVAVLGLIFCQRVSIGTIKIAVLLFFAFIFGQVLNANQISQFLGFFDISYIDKKIADYIAMPGFSGELGITPGLFLRLILFGIYCYYEKAISQKNPNYYMIRSLSFLGIFIFLIFNSFEVLATRLSYYFRFFDVIIISHVLFSIKGLRFKLLSFAFIVLYAFQGLYRELNRHEVYFPYHMNEAFLLYVFS